MDPSLGGIPGQVVGSGNFASAAANALPTGNPGQGGVHQATGAGLQAQPPPPPPNPLAAQMEQQTSIILQLQQQMLALTNHVNNVHNQGVQPGIEDFNFLSRQYQDPRAQQSPETSGFPFSRRVLSDLPAGQIGVSDMVLLNYKAFPE